jgi:HlyD family secretion protein/macrolide-specific efflux system membrane fusion protein
MGTISYVYFEENDEVEQGDVLFKVSVPDKSNVETYDEINTMYENVAIMNEYIETEAVLAPYDGIVGTVSAVEGAEMAAGMSAVEIKPSSGFEVSISVDEDELDEIYVGQSAEITFADEYVLDGEIVHINYNAVSGSSSATFTVYVSLYECEQINENKILPGMVGDVSIIISESLDAIRVPLEALFTDSTGTYVMLFTGDQDISQYEVYSIPTEQCYIETGITSDLYAEVLSGVESGQQVIMVSSSNSEMYQGFMNRDMGGGMDFGGEMPSGGGMPEGGGSPPDMGGGN